MIRYRSHRRQLPFLLRFWNQNHTDGLSPEAIFINLTQKGIGQACIVQEVVNSLPPSQQPHAGGYYDLLLILILLYPDDEGRNYRYSDLSEVTQRGRVKVESLFSVPAPLFRHAASPLHTQEGLPCSPRCVAGVAVYRIREMS